MALALVVVLAQLAMAVPADAAEYRAATFECRGLRGPGQAEGTFLPGPADSIDISGSGQVDALGNFYLPCGLFDGMQQPHIKVYDATGTLRQTVRLDFGDDPSIPASDVAPSPDGSYLYVTNSSCFYADGRLEIVKFSADGRWLDTIKPSSELRKKVHTLGVDADGNIYLAEANLVLRASAPPAAVSLPGGPASSVTEADIDAGTAGSEALVNATRSS